MSPPGRSPGGARLAVLAVRRLARTPLFTATALLVLALGLGANIAIFAVVRGVLLRPLPYADPERLVGVWFTAPGIDIPKLNQCAATFLTLRDSLTPREAASAVFTDVGLWDDDRSAVTGLGEPEEVVEISVSDGAFAVLGVAPARGRFFAAEDARPGAPETVVLSWSYWQERLGGGDDALGKNLTLDGRARQVIGVLPRGFRFLDFTGDVFTPFQFERDGLFVGMFNYQAFGRLRPGATLAQANALVARLIPVAVEQFPGGLTLQVLEEARIGPDVHPLADDLVGEVSRVLWFLFSTVGLVLAIACANVANLFLVRAEGRRRETALRTALGASRGRLARHILGEALVLWLAGGALGTLLAAAALGSLRRFGPESLPRLPDIRLDGAVALYALLLSAAAGAAFGLLPLLRVGRRTFAADLREGARGGGAARERQRLRGALVVAQVASALVLLVGSGLLVRTFSALRAVPPGFEEPDALPTFRLTPPRSEVPDDLAAARLIATLAQELRGLPGVTTVGVGNSAPMDGSDSNDALMVEGFEPAPGQLPPVRRFKFVGADYFAALRSPLLAGRAITWDDVERRSPVVVVSASLAREYWPTPGAALGGRVRSIDPSDLVPGGQGQPWREIVGVAADEYDDGVDQPAPRLVYWPMAVDKFWGGDPFVQRSMVFLLRTEGEASNLAAAAQRVVWARAPTLPLANLKTQGEHYRRSLSRTTFTLTLLVLAAAIALVLAVVGLYGVITYLVSLRTRELGVRLALGAAPRDVVVMMVRQGSVLAAAGVAIGLGACLLAMRLITGLLHGVSPRDPLAYAAVTALLLAVTVLASLVAARRAGRVDPITSLRAE